MNYSSSLITLTAALSEAVTCEEVSSAMLEQLGGVFNADLGSAYLVSRRGQQLRLIHAFGARADLYRQLLPTEGDGAVHAPAFERKAPLFVESRDQLVVRFPPQATVYAESLQVRALIIIPFFTKAGAPLGTVGLAFSSEREFTSEERNFVVISALTCGQALERACAYAREQRARLEAERLQNVTAKLVRASSEHDVAAALAEGLRLLEGDTAVVFNVASDAPVLNLLASSGLSEEFVSSVTRIPLRAASPIAAPVLTGESVFVEGPQEYLQRYPESASTLGRAAGTAAFACIPLLGAADERLGCLAVGYLEPHSFSNDERLYLSALAGVGSQAFQKARLLEQERRMLQQERRTLHAAETAARMKDEFLATVSHELRTPLNAILGWSAMLRKRPREDIAFVDNALAVIDRNARSQAQIIDDILDVSRMITGQLKVHPEPLDLEAIVFEAIETIRHAANSKGVEIDVQLLTGPYTIVADPARLRQVAWNLLSNAVRYSEAQGQIRVCLERTADYLVLSIADTGRGIDPAFLPFVWDRFRQGDASPSRSSGGLGLGLAIVRSLVEMHGGQVSAESGGVGLGACFTISLPHAVPVTAPASEVRARDSEVPPSIASDEPLRGANLLVVDDDDDSRALFEMVLKHAGAGVRVAASAAQAVEMVQAERADVLISDIGMPGDDGYSLLDRMRALLPDPPTVLAVSGYARPEDVRRALDSGFAQHLAKPVEPSRLVDAVKYAWQGHTARSNVRKQSSR